MIATFKYSGSDYEGDMRKVGKDPETQRWWEITDGMQESLVEGAEGSGKDIPWWTVSMILYQTWNILINYEQELEQVFRFEGKAS